VSNPGISFPEEVPEQKSLFSVWVFFFKFIMELIWENLD
jgi:hypothetical protein